MRDFFDMEGPFFRAIVAAVDAVYLTALFLVCCIPVITIGAAMSGLYYCAHKNLRHGHGYVAREFFKGFKDNFKQATPVWLMFLLIYGVLGTECYLMYQYAILGQGIGKVYILLMVIIALVVCWNLYVFPYMARFSNKTGAILKNAAFFMIGNMGYTVMLFVLLVFFMLLIVSWPILVIILPAGYGVILEYTLEKVFERYMTPEDKAAEEERNREYKN